MYILYGSRPRSMLFAAHKQVENRCSRQCFTRLLYEIMLLYMCILCSYNVFIIHLSKFYGQVKKKFEH